MLVCWRLYKYSHTLHVYEYKEYILLISSVQLLSRVRLFATPWTAACQTSLSITNFRSPLKPMSIESMMPSNHLILCHPFLLLPSIFPSIRVFSNESALHIRWLKHWSFSFNISPSNEYSGLISLGWTGWISLQSKGHSMDRVLWHCTGDREQDHPQEKEMQKSKMAVWGGLTNSCEKKRSEKQRRKGKI